MVMKIISKGYSLIAKQITKALAPLINRKVLNMKRDIRSFARRAIEDAMRESPEFDSLVSGVLAYHFGFEAGSELSRVHAIIETLVNQVSFDYIPMSPDRKSGGVLSFFFINKDFTEILALDEAYIHTEKGASLPWLEWFLLEGDKIILFDYQIFVDLNGKYADFSRHGEAIMVKSRKKPWRVPEYSGTKDDNWITRAILTIADELEVRLAAIIQRELGAKRK